MNAKEVFSATQQLGALNTHHETPFRVLGMDRSHPYESSTALRAIEHNHIAELPDGSHLFSVDQAVCSLIREGLPPGSIIETGVMRSRPIEHDQIQQFLAYTAVAIVLRHDKDATKLLGVVRSPRTEEQSVGLKQGAWGEYSIQHNTYSEKHDTHMALSRLFSVQSGIEGSQMLSMLFQPSTVASGGTESSISSAGCFSHEKPLEAIPQNLISGGVLTFPIDLRGDNPMRILRVRIDTQSDVFMPLSSSSDAVDEEHILSVGLIQRAQSIAATNPIGMGAGSSPEKVLHAMMETTIQLPDLVVNGATMKQAARVLKEHLGVRS